MLSSSPDRVREANCLLGTLASRRAAGTGREDPQPDSHPFQLRFAVKRTFSAELRGGAESKKACAPIPKVKRRTHRAHTVYTPETLNPEPETLNPNP